MNLMAVIDWIQGVLGFLLGIGIGFLIWRWRCLAREKACASQQAERLEEAQRQSETLIREARLAAQEEAIRLRQEAEDALATRRQECDGWQQRLAEREQLVNQQLAGLVERERSLREHQREVEERQAKLKAQQSELNGLLVEQREQLQRTAHLSEAEARAALLKQVERDSLKDAADLSRHVLEEARTRAEDQARRILGLAIQRYAGDHTSETSTATVALDGADLKGRIIGREGRNIRAFEAATGVTVLIDDTPNAVVISGFDPVRREVARQAMEHLILDGRIHPTRIEEVVAKVTKEIEETIARAGEDAVFKVGLPPIHPELSNLLGRLRFRYSFSQNVLDHSIEVAHLAGLIAAELGLDPALAKRAGLLHDIGKAVNHEVEGSHALVGADLVRRCGESPEVVEAVAAHHDEVTSNSLLAIVLSAADTISASRPGARSESMTTYLKRLENLEQIGGDFPGVEKCYAVQAGRELRVIVQPGTIDDDQAQLLARDIARKIENNLHYPGQIRVTVVRETRCVEFAK